MKKLLLLSSAVCLTASHVPAAHAQAALYGEVSASNYGYTVYGGSLSYSTDGVGGMFGGFYNFPIQSRLTAGLDAHIGFGTSSPGGVKGFVAARLGFVPERHPLRPYLEVGGGFVSTHVPRLTNIVGPQTVTSGALELAGGLDVRLTQALDYRAVEIEGGAGAGTRVAASASLSTGVVYRFSAAPHRH